MTAKLRIKAKGIEIEWEGEVDYLKNDLPALISAIVAALGIDPSDDDADEEESAGAETAARKSTSKTFTTAALAAKVGPDTAQDLFKVALTKLQLSDGIEPAPRAVIHNEMKAAPKFYKPAMRSNLGKTINSLLSSGDINEPSAGKFTLTANAQAEIEAKM